jgi:hypothetical protein
LSPSHARWLTSNLPQPENWLSVIVMPCGLPQNTVLLEGRDIVFHFCIPSPQHRGMLLGHSNACLWDETASQSHLFPEGNMHLSEIFSPYSCYFWAGSSKGGFGYKFSKPCLCHRSRSLLCFTVLPLILTLINKAYPYAPHTKPFCCFTLLHK